MSWGGVTTFTPLFPADTAAAMVALCERFGSYGMYSEEPTFAGLGEGLPARWDAVRNFLKTGDRVGRREPLEVLAARTNYFRETYAYGAAPAIDGIEPFLFHEGFVEAARRLHGRPVVEPAIVFANLLVPGQELAVHTDVPEFRGVSRKSHPQWLIVVMRHSGLFEAWRMPIATAVAWFHDCTGGEFVYYPDGPEAPPVAHPVRYNTALLLDTDSVFHGVAPLAEPGTEIAPLRPGMRLTAAGGGWWEVRDGERRVARYRWEDLRFSVSWKAYCFADEAERRLWAEHRDDLTVDAVVERLLEDLRARGVVGADVPRGNELVDLLIDTYVRYPKPTA
ncbi:MAG TPA: hypothetical protein VNO26_15835 [Candidatus Limnocylindria bacterium]|nr:hypothetical protein [Candidatus Limnocylindria bacterium]